MIRPRVLIAVGTLDVGGAETQILELSRRLRERFEFHVVSHSAAGPLASPLRDAGVELHALSPEGRSEDPGRVERARRLFVSSWRLRRLLARLRPALVHAYLFEMSVVAAAARWPRRAPPLVVSRRSLVEWIARDRIYFPLARWTNRRADLLLANSEAVRRDAIAKEGLPADRIRVIYNGVDTDVYAPGPADPSVRTELSIPANSVVIGMVANQHAYKGHADVVRAAQILAKSGDRFTLLFVGREGNASQELRALIRQRGLEERVVLVGQRSDVPRVLRAIDVFVSASHEEGFSNSILEAMSSGLPVIATAVGGTVEQVVDGETGFLVPPRDPAALAEKLAPLLGDAGLRARFGAAGRARVVERFSIERLVREMSDLYARLASAETSASR